MAEVESIVDSRVHGHVETDEAGSVNEADPGVSEEPLAF